MDRVVGRTASRDQPGHRVDDGFLVDHLAERPLAAPCKFGQAMDGGAGQRLAQRRAGVDESGVGDVQPHQLHHHLVGIGGAVEGAGAGRMVGRALGLQQLVLADLALRIELADALLFLVGKTRRHRPAGDQKHRQMAKTKRADQQAGNDFVANAEQRRRVEHAVAERDRRAHRDDVAAEQRKVHARLALRHPVAHRRHAARDLRRGADFAGENLHLLGVAGIRLMGRQHVVVSGYNSDVRPGEVADRLLVLARGGEAVGEIAATEARPVDPPLLLLRHQLEIAAARGLRPFDDPVGDRGDGGMEAHGSNVGLRRYSCQLMPSRSASAIAAVGPQVPAG